MHDINVNFASDEEYPCDIMIEGLPGVGQVGKLVAEYMIRELDAEKIGEITSLFFPPQVLIEENGVVRLPDNELYRYVDKKTGLKILFLVGDFQSTSPEGHYLLADTYLDIAEKLGVKRIYTLGGFGVGRLLDDIKVLCTANDEKLLPIAKKAGAIVTEGEPGGGIIGASGLLLGLGYQRKIEGICLMGETSGYLVDPISAACVLSVLTKILGIKVDAKNLQKKAEEMEKFVQSVKESENAKSDEELSYIG